MSVVIPHYPNDVGRFIPLGRVVTPAREIPESSPGEPWTHARGQHPPPVMFEPTLLASGVVHELVPPP
jgi:hypothetical protein